MHAVVRAQFFRQQQRAARAGIVEEGDMAVVGQCGLQAGYGRGRVVMADLPILRGACGQFLSAIRWRHGFYRCPPVASAFLAARWPELVR
ncbi:hypothetical protein BRM24_10795, partial [Xanthomonas oryzae pv. oryzae]